MDSNSGLSKSSPGAALRGEDPGRPGSSWLLLTSFRLGGRAVSRGLGAGEGVGGVEVSLAEALSLCRRQMSFPSPLPTGNLPC